MQNGKLRKLFKNELTIDTVFRPSKNNEFVKNEIINVKKMSFMKSKQLISKYNNLTLLITIKYMKTITNLSIGNFTYCALYK